MSTLKVNTIQDTTGNDALTIDSSGNVTASQGFVPSTQLSHRNLIINGAMNVAQRGTSSAVGNSSVYVLDRFVSEAESSGMTVSQEVEAPSGFKYSLKCLNGTGSASSGSEATYIRQFIEGYNVRQLAIGTSDAKAVTLSFWVRSSITGTYIVSFLDSGNDNGYPASYTINTADTWEYKTITLTMSTYSGWVGNSTTGRGLVVHWDLGSGSDRDATTVNAWNDGAANDWTHSSQTDWVATTGATFYLTGVQLEVGSVATPFEHRSYGEELARCSRYYQRQGRDDYNHNDSAFFTATGWTSSYCYGPYYYPMGTMRTNPSMSVGRTEFATGWCNSTQTTPSAVTFPGVGTSSCELSFSGSSGWAGGDSIWWRFNTTSSTDYIEMDAEL